MESFVTFIIGVILATFMAGAWWHGCGVEQGGRNMLQHFDECKINETVRQTEVNAQIWVCYKGRWEVKETLWNKRK